MISKLQKKLTLTALCTLVLIFVLVVAAINIAYGAVLRNQISQSLSILTGRYAESSVQSSHTGTTRRTRDGLPAVRASTVSRMTDFCVIRLNRNGDLHEWKSENTEQYSDETVEALLNAIREQDREEGCVEHQAYRQEERNYGTLIVAMDVRVEDEYARMLLMITAIVGGCTCVLLSVLSVLLIRRTMKPVQEAVTKQQQFIWDASHELKTPMAAISANTQALERDMGDNPCFRHILAEVRRMNELVQNLLTLARMDNGQTFTMERFDLGAALEGVALPMEPLAFEMGKTLQTQLGEGIFCVGNEPLICQLTTILLTNALQYSNEGGTVTLSLEKRGRQRLIRVHNTGSYLPPEEQEKVFDRFYRADHSHSRKTGGSGIGLAIARSIAQLHHGEIRIDSSPEDGTAFTVVLEDQG